MNKNGFSYYLISIFFSWKSLFLCRRIKMGKFRNLRLFKGNVRKKENSALCRQKQLWKLQVYENPGI